MSWYEELPIEELVGEFTKALQQSEADSVLQLSLQLMRDHSLRKNTGEEALKELETVSARMITVRRNITDSISKDVEYRLPVNDDVKSMTNEEKAAFKKQLSQLMSACDTKSEEQTEK